MNSTACSTCLSRGLIFHPHPNVSSCPTLTPTLTLLTSPKCQFITNSNLMIFAEKFKSDQSRPKEIEDMLVEQLGDRFEPESDGSNHRPAASQPSVTLK